MTSTPAHGQEPIERWLAACHRDLCDGLSQFLDPDADLREIMLHAEHSELLGALDSHLDAQAGLAAILPSPAAAGPQPPPIAPETTADIETTTPPASHGPDQALAATMISFRIRASDLARALSSDLARAQASHLTRAQAGDRAHASGHTRALARALASDLAHASNFAHASDLARASDMASALTSGRDLTRDLALVSTLVGTLTAQEVDASGADLSNIDMEIRHLGLLNGTIWTRETTWPVAVAAQVEDQSDEVRPGVYQVRLGDTPDRDPVRLV